MTDDIRTKVGEIIHGTGRQDRGPRLSAPKRNCRNCRNSGMNKAADGTLQTVCRAEYPKVTATFIGIPGQAGPQLIQATVWPVMADFDWCAKHEPELAS